MWSIEATLATLGGLAYVYPLAKTIHKMPTLT